MSEHSEGVVVTGTETAEFHGGSVESELQPVEVTRPDFPPDHPEHPEFVSDAFTARARYSLRNEPA